MKKIVFLVTAALMAVSSAMSYAQTPSAGDKPSPKVVTLKEAAQADSASKVAAPHPTSLAVQQKVVTLKEAAQAEAPVQKPAAVSAKIVTLKEAAEKDGSAPKVSVAKCDKGFRSMGVISKIDIGKDGKTTESIRLVSGKEQKMPSFKADKNYKSKVGDPYCIDMTPDNN